VIPLRLVPLSQDEYDKWWVAATREYAEEHRKAGNWTAEEALQKSEAEFRILLSDGVATPDHFLFALEGRTPGESVGVVWFHANRGKATPGPPCVFIYDLRVYEPFRGKGYGTQAMRLVEEKARELGFDTISLHVFGTNQVAISLYEKLGYVATNLKMSKKI
jgi:ribosomal protein S18 acetylase RimI-like enzyme